ncbi:MAG: N-acetylmuramoyl-L-alanine amidase [Nitrospiraceae bacterium]|nr:N-acetylmuramoyl-L-alanine amidase [Nitrospiraceae bacterium]
MPFIFCAAVLIFQWAFFQQAGAAQAIVAIDPGHGGYDEGIVYNADGKEISEKKLDLAIARAISAALQAKGANAFLVRSVDRYLGIAQRAQIASARRPALFLSVHLASADAFQVYVSLMPSPQLAPVPSAAAGQAMQAGTGGAAGAAGTPAGGPAVLAAPVNGGQAINGGQAGPDQQALRQYYLYSMRQRPYLGKSRDFASALEQSLKQAFPGGNISYMEIPLPLLDAIAAPAVLIECPGPQYMDYTQPVISGIAQAVANAVMAYGAH